MTRDENYCEALAEKVVDSWDMDSLLSFAIAELTQNLMTCDKEEFDQVVEDFGELD